MEEAKRQLHILHDDEDALINQAMEAAVTYCEEFLQYSLTSQTLLASYLVDGRDFAELFGNSEIEVKSIKYFNDSNDTSEISTDLALLDTSLGIPRLYFTEPRDVHKTMLAPIKIEFEVKTASIRNELIKQAALIAIDCYISNPTSPDFKAVDNILKPLKIGYLL